MSEMSENVGWGKPENSDEQHYFVGEDSFCGRSGIKNCVISSSTRKAITKIFNSSQVQLRFTEQTMGGIVDESNALRKDPDPKFPICLVCKREQTHLTRYIARKIHIFLAENE